MGLRLIVIHRILHYICSMLSWLSLSHHTVTSIFALCWYKMYIGLRMGLTAHSYSSVVAIVLGDVVVLYFDS